MSNNDYIVLCVASRWRNRDGYKGQILEVCPEPGKCFCLTTVDKNNLIYQLPRGANPGGDYVDKSPTMTANAWQENNVVIEASCLTLRRTEYGKAIRKDYDAGRIDAHRAEIQALEPRTDGKTNTVTTVQKDNLIMLTEYQSKNLRETDEKAHALLATMHKGSGANGMTLVKEVVQINESTESNGTQPYQQNRVYAPNGLVPALCASRASIHNVVERERIRRLTPTECARLQTIPAWYKWVVSETQQYKMLGNGWTVEVIKHIFSFLPEHLKH